MAEMPTAWLQQKERGTPFTLRLISLLAQRLGRRFGRMLLYPISFYYVLFVPKSRRASRFYLTRVLGRKPTPVEIFRHFHTFAATILDRVFLLTNRVDEFDLAVHGYEPMHQLYRRGKGCLLLGSHLGSFELLRALADRESDVTFRTLMYLENAGKINEVLREINPEIAETVIPIGRTDSMLRVMESLQRGHMVGMLGDRVALDEKLVQCDFFDESCAFPAGPMITAGLLEVPVVLFFGLYLGGNRYEIFFEVLSEGFSLERENRAEQLQQMTQRYVARMEHYCRSYPYNWFNFYDFWNDAGR